VFAYPDLGVETGVRFERSVLQALGQGRELFGTE
jgi:hypothetical protein